MVSFLSGVSTIFSRLVDHSIEISALICLIFLVKWIAAKRLPSWWHCSLWLMLLVRMLVPIEFENRLNVFNFIPDISEHQVLDMITDSSADEMIPLSESALNVPSESPNWRFILKNSVPMVWFFGAMVLGICILFKSISFWMSVRRIPPISDKKVLFLLAQCKSRMKINAEIDIIVTDKVRSPALFGYFHARLLLPKGIFERLNDKDLSYAFMHELGHLKRHDIGVSWIGAVIQAAYWFNPLVWVALYQMRVDQESACDEAVLSHIKRDQSQDYAKAIVGFLEKFYQNCQLPSLAGVMENKTQMKRRIANIVHFKKYSQKLKITAVTLFISTGFIFYSFTGVAIVKQTQSKVIPIVEKSSDIDAATVTDGRSIPGAEMIPGDFFATRTDVSSKTLHPTQGNISPSIKEAWDVPEVPRENHTAFTKEESVSQNHTETTETTYAAMKQPVSTPEPFSRDNVSSLEAGNSADSDRTAKKGDELSVDSGPRALEAGPPVITGVARKPEAEGHQNEPAAKKPVSLAAFTEKTTPTGISTGSSSADSVEVVAEKKAVETKHEADVSRRGPDGATRDDGLRETDSVRGSNQIQVVAHKAPVVSAEGGEIGVSGVTETLSGNKAVHAALKTDQEINSEGVGTLASEVDRLPRVIKTASPKYPYKAKRDKISGYIKLRFIVTKDGDAVDMTVVESSPKGVFEKSALEAIESYRFKPGMKDGKAVDVKVNLPIKYDLS